MVGQVCAAGEVLKYSEGWGCAPDLTASYTAGTGLTLSDTTFALDTDFTDAVDGQPSSHTDDTAMAHAANFLD